MFLTVYCAILTYSHHSYYHNYMAHKHVNHENAKAIIGLLIVCIGFVLFYKFFTNQQFFTEDLNAMRNYVVLSIVSMGFLLGLFFLVGRSHPKPATKKAHKPSSKSTKKKKK